MQRTQTSFHQAIEEEDPISFIKILFQRDQKSVSTTDEKTRLTVLQHAAMKERADVLPYIFEADPTIIIDETIPIPIDECLPKDSQNYRALHDYEQTPLMLAIVHQKQFDIAPDVLLALGANLDKALKLCRDDKTNVTLQEATLDYDIFCGLFYWTVIHSKNPSLLDRLEAQIDAKTSAPRPVAIGSTATDAKYSSTATSTDAKNSLKKIPLERMEKDLFGLMELAAQQKAPLIANKLLKINQNKSRLNLNICTAQRWAALNDLKDMYTPFEDAKDIEMQSDRTKLTENQRLIYDISQSGHPEYLKKSSAEKDLLAVIDYAYQERDFVALNTLIQFYIKNNLTLKLFQHTIERQNRGLFFIVVFATDLHPRELSQQLSNQHENLLALMGSNHQQLPSQKPNFEIPLTEKIKLIDDFLTMLNNCVMTYGLGRRLWDLSCYQKTFLFGSLACIGGIAVSSYFLYSFSAQNTTLVSQLQNYTYINPDTGQSSSCANSAIGSGPFITCSDLVSDDDCPPCSSLGSNSSASLGCMMGLLASVILIGSQHLPLCYRQVDSTVRLIYRALFSDLGHKEITDIPNHGALDLKAERIISKLQTVPDFKLTIHSTVSDFRTGLKAARKTLEDSLKRFGMFSIDIALVAADSKAGQPDSTPLPKLKDYKKLNG